jgi:hypothetical protein
MNKQILVILTGLAVIFFACTKEDNNSLAPDHKVFTYDFASGYDGWAGGFAEWHPPYAGNDWNFVFERTPLPAPLNSSKYSLKIGGMNRSDDLFMFIKRKIGGLKPNVTYQTVFDVEFASDVPTNKYGVGGSPDAVMMKAGAMPAEPDTIYSRSENLFKMKNVDKGIQLADGIDMFNLGKIGVAENTTQYTLISRNNDSRPKTITASANGEVWICIGTDSGFEGRTEIYYSKIIITFSQQEK